MCNDGGPGSLRGSLETPYVCVVGEDCTDCGPRPVGICSNACHRPNLAWHDVDHLDSGNTSCEDGGPGSDFAACEYGTDCIDCGVRPWLVENTVVNTVVNVTVNVTSPETPDQTNLPVSPGACIGITFGSVTAIGLVFAWLLRSELRSSNWRCSNPNKMLGLEFLDWLLDGMTFALAFYAGDLGFDNDPDQILRTFLLIICVLSTVSWAIEVVLFHYCRDAFLAKAQHLNLFHLLFEDGTQTVLYSIIASANASGAEASVMQVVLAFCAAGQSLIFFIQKALDLFSGTLEEADSYDQAVPNGSSVRV